MPPESDIDGMVKYFWGRVSGEVGFANEEEWDRWSEEITPHFENPTIDASVALAEFVQWFDPEPLMELLEGRYEDFERVKKRLPERLRFFAYFVLSSEVYLSKAYRRLGEADFQALGFKKRPNYEMLREFIYERIERKRFKAFFDRMVKELRAHLQVAGIPFGLRISQDATDMPSLKHDPEANYNDYYKEYGYKADVTIDLDHETLPLDYCFTGINESEERNLIPTLKNLATRGIHPKEHKVDGGYPSFKNIAYSESHSTHLIYCVQNGWVEKPEINEATVKKRYQRYHMRSDFRVVASLEFMLLYLQKRGEHELVGNFYRNATMSLEGDLLKSHQDSYKERSVKMEGFYGTAKCHTTLGRRPPRRGKDAMRFILDLSMLAFVFAAVIRVQNGVFTGLGNLGHFG